MLGERRSNSLFAPTAPAEPERKPEQAEVHDISFEERTGRSLFAENATAPRASELFFAPQEKSHDTEDGILEPGAPDFERKLLMLQRKPRARYRINHISWWAQEMPSEEEYAEARKNLAKVDWAVDYVITHCAPTSIALMENRHNEADPLTDFLQEVKERAHYHYWLFGHYHDNRAIDEKHILLWEQIVQVI